MTRLAALVAAGVGVAALFDATGAQDLGARSATVTIDAARPGDPLPRELFGINSTWGDAGGGIVEFGEMLRDRSFRNPEKLRVWIEAPNRETQGKIRIEKRGGDPSPWGGKGYAGHAVLGQRSAGYTCLSQQTIEGTVRGERYELHLSARADGAKVAIAAFFADRSFMPIEPADRFVAVEAGAWSDYRFVLEPGRTDAFGLLRVCLASPGTVAIDEVRLRRIGGSPRVKEIVLQRLKSLGVRSLRWPAGSDADYFAWRESIGPMRSRGENAGIFGAYQTPSWGLHEFLDLCESLDLVPLITFNIRESPQSAADLFEYINGPSASSMGSLRAANGRVQPWQVRHFELGNEPAEAYRGPHSGGDTAQGYVELARAVARAVRERATALRRPVELKAALETTFALAEWIGLVPMLSKWNGTVLDRGAGLVREVDQLHGHFYSAFTYREDDKQQFREVMAGGATLAAVVRDLRRKYGPLPPFWLTEYSVIVEKKKFFGSNQILLERAKDFQAGLAAADLLITAIREGYGGAHLFNLSEFGTWGVLANARDFRLRPAGYAFALLAPMAGERRLEASVTGGRTVTAKGGDGNNRSNTRFASLAAVASRGERELRVVLLNRSYDVSDKVRIDTGQFTPRRARIVRLGPADPKASNDEKADTVAPVTMEVEIRGPHVIDLPPRSLLSVSYPLE